jgi:hypothetical protein
MVSENGRYGYTITLAAGLTVSPSFAPTIKSDVTNTMAAARDAATTTTGIFMEISGASETILVKR